jgi:hypothetical protein
MFVRLFAAVAVASLVCSCALHPVPEDVTGVNTYHIARQIRCETRDAAREFVLNELRRLAADPDGDPIAKRLLTKYESEPDSISTFKPELFPGPNYARVRDFFTIVYSAGIAYNFDLTMSEDNNIGTNMSLLGPWVPKFTLGIVADLNRTRTNQRTFTLTDTFGSLLTKLGTPVRGRRYCDGQIVQANYVYPVAGSIGVDELVKTFFELIFFTNAAHDLSKDPAGAPTIADKLTFTTTIDGTVTPTVTFTPVGRGFQVASASLPGTLRRTDTHKVTVGLAIEPAATASIASIRNYIFSTRRGEGSPAPAVSSGPAGRVLLANSLTAHAGTGAESLAVLAVDQLKSREVQIVTAP